MPPDFCYDVPMVFESPPQKSLLPEGYYYHPEGYLWFILPVEKFAALPETVDVEGITLAKKSEFHVTVINARKVAHDIAGGDADETARVEEGLQTLLTEYVRENPMAFDKFADDLRLATAPERVSIAARCCMRGVEGYFQRIQDCYNFTPPAQPLHTSLYTLPGVGAVGINTDEEMESFKKVDLLSVQAVLNSI